MIQCNLVPIPEVFQPPSMFEWEGWFKTDDGKVVGELRAEITHHGIVFRLNREAWRVDGEVVDFLHMSNTDLSVPTIRRLAKELNLDVVEVV